MDTIKFHLPTIEHPDLVAFHQTWYDVTDWRLVMDTTFNFITYNSQILESLAHKYIDKMQAWGSNWVT